MKKMTVVALLFSLLGLSASLEAREGAKLRIQKKDGQKVEGELIGIKGRSLMLIDGSRDSVSCAIDEAVTIVVGKKSKFLTGAVPGFLLGAVGGALLGSAASKPNPPSGKVDFATGFGYALAESYAPAMGGVAGGALGGLVGLLIGGMISGSAQSGQEVIRLEGKSQGEIDQLLYKLRFEARFPDYK